MFGIKRCIVSIDQVQRTDRVDIRRVDSKARFIISAFYQRWDLPRKLFLSKSLKYKLETYHQIKSCSATLDLFVQPANVPWSVPGKAPTRDASSPRTHNAPKTRYIGRKCWTRGQKGSYSPLTSRNLFSNSKVTCWREYCGLVHTLGVNRRRVIR